MSKIIGPLKLILILITLGSTLSFGQDVSKHERKAIQVNINKNIELFGLMLQLDLVNDIKDNTHTLIINHRKTTWREWYTLSFRNYSRYKKFYNSKMMDLYRSYSKQGFYNDFFIGLLLQVDDVPFAKINVNTERELIMKFSMGNDFEVAKNILNAFLEEFNRFYEEVGFAQYLNENNAYYQHIIRDVKKNLTDKNFIPVMEAFYQKGFSRYMLIPALNIPTSSGFGKMIINTQTIYNIFGPFSFQSLDTEDPDLGFDHADQIERVSIHEFGHSFVNPAVDKVPKELVNSSRHLYAPIKEAMAKRSYTSWEICLYEHFVRAGEIIIAEKLGDSRAATLLMERNLKAGFKYLPSIVDQLKIYDQNKGVGMYKTYDGILPTVIEKLKQNM